MLGSYVKSSVVECWLMPSIKRERPLINTPSTTFQPRVKKFQSLHMSDPVNQVSIRMSIKRRLKCQLRVWIGNINPHSTRDALKVHMIPISNVARQTQWISCMGDIAWANDQQSAIKSLHPARTRVDKRSNSSCPFALLTTLLKVDNCSWKSQSIHVYSTSCISNLAPYAFTASTATKGHAVMASHAYLWTSTFSKFSNLVHTCRNLQLQIDV